MGGLWGVGGGVWAGKGAGWAALGDGCWVPDAGVYLQVRTFATARSSRSLTFGVLIYLVVVDFAVRSFARARTPSAFASSSHSPALARPARPPVRLPQASPGVPVRIRASMHHHRRLAAHTLVIVGSIYSNRLLSHPQDASGLGQREACHWPLRNGCPGGQAHIACLRASAGGLVASLRNEWPRVLAAKDVWSCDLRTVRCCSAFSPSGPLQGGRPSPPSRRDVCLPIFGRCPWVL